MSYAGHRHTPESKAKIAAALKDRPRPPETRRRISRAKRGTKFSAATRAKLSKIRKEEGRMAALWRNPAWCRANSERVSKRLAERWKDPDFRAAVCKKIGDARRGMKCVRVPCYITETVRATYRRVGAA